MTTPAETIIEQMAKAIAASNREDPNEPVYGGDGSIWTLYLDDAQAAYAVIAPLLQERDDEIARLKATSDCLMESQYRAGVKAGWNFSEAHDLEGYLRCMEYNGHLAAPLLQVKDANGVTIPREVYDFLMGEGPLDGTWFGEMNGRRLGPFWWRAILKIAALSQQEKVG